MQVSTDPVPPGKGGSPMWMWVLIVVLILAVIGAGVFVVMSNKDGFVKK